MHSSLRTSAILLLAAGLSACVGNKSSFGGANSTTVDGATVSIDCSTAAPGESFRADTVCAHNDIRQAPPSPQPNPRPPLPPLVWNENLAELARGHAEQCVYEHSDKAVRTEAFGQWVGENLAAGTADAYTDRTVVRLWAEEAANYDYQSNSCAEGNICGHYTQIVWRGTTQIGCAKVTCDDVANQPGLGRADLWVCNYLPGGNIVGERPY